VRLHPLRDAVLACSSAVSSAHILSLICRSVLHPHFTYARINGSFAIFESALSEFHCVAFDPFVETGMQIYVIMGAGCVGLLIGSMVRVVFRNIKTVDVKTLGSIISVMAGAGVIAVFQLVNGKGMQLPAEVWCYPIGLFLGYSFTAALEPDMEPTE
jgi:hypothetical protein